MKLPPLWDPALDAHVPETRAFNAKLPKEETPARWTPEAIARARDLSQIMGGVFATKAIAGFEERTITGPAGPLRLRVFVPPTVRAVYLDVHGGGFFMGAPEMDDAANAALARRAQVATVAVGYRLAPEHPWPAGPDDCEAAALWLLENARREFGSERLAIGGESAGAHLSAVTALRLRDRHHVTPFRGANLVYGIYDLGFTPSVRNWGERNLILSTPIIEWFSNHFIPDQAKRATSDASPLYADLHSLPPALFTIGTLDPLLDDSLFMSARWAAAGARYFRMSAMRLSFGWTMTTSPSSLKNL